MAQTLNFLGRIKFMNMLDLLSAVQGGNGLKSLGAQFGLDDSQTQDAVRSLLPALSSGLKRNTAQPEGLAGLLAALQSGKHAQFADNQATLASPDALAQGNGILGHILGSKDVSRAVADRAAQQTGIGSGLLKQMLPVIASMVMGSLAKNTNVQAVGNAPNTQNPATSGDLLSSVLGGLLGGANTPGQPTSATDIFGSMLDVDGDGSSMDDIFDMAKKMFS